MSAHSNTAANPKRMLQDLKTHTRGHKYIATIVSSPFSGIKAEFTFPRILELTVQGESFKEAFQQAEAVTNILSMNPTVWMVDIERLVRSDK